MHDLSVIRRQQVEVSARQHSAELLAFLEKSCRLLDTDSPLGNEARVLLDKVCAPLREARDGEINTGPHTYIPSGTDAVPHQRV